MFGHQGLGIGLVADKLCLQNFEQSFLLVACGAAELHTKSSRRLRLSYFLLTVYDPGYLLPAASIMPTEFLIFEAELGNSEKNQQQKNTQFKAKSYRLSFWDEAAGSCFIGRALLPYISYIGICGSKAYGFHAVLV